MISLIAEIALEIMKYDEKAEVLKSTAGKVYC